MLIALATLTFSPNFLRESHLAITPYLPESFPSRAPAPRTPPSPGRVNFPRGQELHRSNGHATLSPRCVSFSDALSFIDRGEMSNERVRARARAGLRRGLIGEKCANLSILSMASIASRDTDTSPTTPAAPGTCAFSM